MNTHTFHPPSWTPLPACSTYKKILKTGVQTGKAGNKHAWDDRVCPRVQGRSIQSLWPFGVLTGAMPLQTVVLQLTPIPRAKVTARMPLIIITRPARLHHGKPGEQCREWWDNWVWWWYRLIVFNLHIITYKVIPTALRLTEAASSPVCAHTLLCCCDSYIQYYYNIYSVLL